MKHPPLFKAFIHAFNGIRHFFTDDRNGKIHGCAAAGVLIAGYCFKLSVTEWCLVLVCISLVTSFEMLNHAIEKLCDVASPGIHPLIKTTKDVAAAAVLVSAITSAVIGLLIFIPKILSLL